MEAWMKHFKENSAEFLIKVSLFQEPNILKNFIINHLFVSLVNSLKESSNPNITEKAKGMDVYLDACRYFYWPSVL